MTTHPTPEQQATSDQQTVPEQQTSPEQQTQTAELRALGFVYQGVGRATQGHCKEEAA